MDKMWGVEHISLLKLNHFRIGVRDGLHPPLIGYKTCSKKVGDRIRPSDNLARPLCRSRGPVMISPRRRDDHLMEILRCFPPLSRIMPGLVLFYGLILSS